MIYSILSRLNVNDCIASFNEKPEEIRIIYIYRYASWFITSLFYLLGPPKSPLIFKAGVIICLYIAARLITDQYIKFNSSPNTIKTLVLVETIGIALLLVPTGGLDSPFIWYALNPGLVAASLLSPYFCWLNLLFYITTAALTSYYIFNQNRFQLTWLLQDKSYLLLILILVTLVVQLLCKLSKQLSDQAALLKKQSEELLRVNERLSESMEHIMSLYQVVEDFNTVDKPHNIPRTFADYAVRLTKAPLSFFWTESLGEVDGSIVFSGEVKDDIKEKILYGIENLWEGLIRRDAPCKVNIADAEYLIAVVKSPSRSYGLIGIELTESEPDNLLNSYTRQLTFLSELSSVIFERVNLQKVADHLMIVEEQNRIANEMHDSISQRMFSITCAIHALTVKWNDMPAEELQRQLHMIKDSASTAMQELRSTIYRLSSKKKGEKALFTNIKTYFDSLSRLNGITVNLNMNGEEDLLPFSLKKALYRIICEAAGNSVRHGKCSTIKINLQIDSTYTYLNIKDDGKGFSRENLNDKNSGLGIYNMQNLVQSFSGSFDIISEIGKGTEIRIKIPIKKSVDQVQGGIA